MGEILRQIAERSLELGCGPAGGSQRLFHVGASKFLEGIDISEEAVADGKRIFANLGVQGNLMVGDVNKIQLPENSYDFIFACHGFHHFVELEHLIDQIYRALTPRGLFLLEEFVGPTELEMVKALLPLLPERVRTLARITVMATAISFAWTAHYACRQVINPGQYAHDFPGLVFHPVEFC